MDAANQMMERFDNAVKQYVEGLTTRAEFLKYMAVTFLVSEDGQIAMHPYLRDEEYPAKPEGTLPIDDNQETGK